jgi:hypothetical protein
MPCAIASGSGVGLLGLIEATSNVASDAAAPDGDAGFCADEAVATSRVARANAHEERRQGVPGDRVERSVIEISFTYGECD